MVAYSFAPFFAQAVAALTKRQTIRAPRKRHARPGEPIQLYAGMRTRHCTKLLDKDPLCVAVRPIEISTSELLDAGIASITIGDWVLDAREIEALAQLDGFAPADFNQAAGTHHSTARANMGAFWLKHHGVGRFEGVLIEWRPS
ncbi:ASCH domain-containing protein [Tianweitania sediminis]|uniref:ASCH domain-containing protein n=1 Tax=Tianweitania sediminis TaxID=1502156 RepID=A0A8J7R088_9HYPH|nr:ASCH domain-containing protein [Tianweitania sediminis]MBP0439460.1 ASCH domain-containing protein [Tianweitania sediminis]